MSEKGILILIAMLSISTMVTSFFDRQEAQDQLEHYCEMVNEGAWPNYKEIDCGEDNE